MDQFIPFPAAALIGRQLDVSSLISAGISVASSVLPEVTSALSIQVTVVPDSTGGSSTTTKAATSTSPASTTAAPTTTSQSSISSTSRSSPSSSSSSIPSSSFSSSAASATPSSTGGGHGGNKTGIIVGVVLGVLVLALLGALLFICIRRRRRNSLIFGRRRPTTPSIDSEAGVDPIAPVAAGRHQEVTQSHDNHHGITPVPPSYQASTMRGGPGEHNPFGDGSRVDRKEGPIRPGSRTSLAPVHEQPEPERAETPSRWPPLAGAYPLDGSDSPSGDSGETYESAETGVMPQRIRRKPLASNSPRDSPTLGATGPGIQQTSTATSHSNPAHAGWAPYYEKSKGTWLDDTY